MTRLPLIARVLMRLVNPDVREFVAGDLEEAFAAMAATDGPAPRGPLGDEAGAGGGGHCIPGSPSPRTRGDGIMRTLLQDLRMERGWCGGSRDSRRWSC